MRDSLSHRASLWKTSQQRRTSVGLPRPGSQKTNTPSSVSPVAQQHDWAESFNSSVPMTPIGHWETHTEGPRPVQLHSRVVGPHRSAAGKTGSR
jgi:hypothetical protein